MGGRFIQHRRDSRGELTLEYRLLMASEAHDVAKALTLTGDNYADARRLEATAWKNLIKATENFLASVPPKFRNV